MENILLYIVIGAIVLAVVLGYNKPDVVKKVAAEVTKATPKPIDNVAPKQTDLNIRQIKPFKFFILLSILFYCVTAISWADPKVEGKLSTQKIWNFDSEAAGTLPANFLVGTLVDGRASGKWQVIDMKTSMSLLDKLDKRDHGRVRKTLQNNEAPSAPHVFAQLKNGGYFFIDE